MADKNLTSLKVYGNDDPAGSTYKVGGGAGGVFMTTGIYDEETSKVYLKTMSGEPVSCQDLLDATLDGLFIGYYERTLTFDGEPGGYSQGFLGNIGIGGGDKQVVPYTAVFFVFGSDSPITFSAIGENDPLAHDAQ